MSTITAVLEVLSTAIEIPMNSSDIQPIPFEQLQQAVFPIIAVAGDAQWHPIGTAFVIAVVAPKTAFLLTAAHNLHYIARVDAPHTQRNPIVAPDFHAEPPSQVNLSSTYVYAFVRNGPGGVLAEMIRSWVCNTSDVALMLMQIRPDDEAEFPYRISLDSRPIREDTPTMAVGYPHMRADFTSPPDYEALDFRVGLGLPFVTRIGKVVSIHPQGFGICRWPGFRVDASFDSGMSGGPVIDLSGPVPLVRGIVCADMSGQFEDGTRIEGRQGFASMLWPAMTINPQITLLGEDGGLLVSEDSRLLDFVRCGVVDDHGQAHDHVCIHQTTSGLAYHYRE